MIKAQSSPAGRCLPRALALLALAALVACAPSGPRIPAARPPAQAVNPAVTLVVRLGDTVYTIAQTHSVPVRALIEANRLLPPYQLQPGRVLVLPQQNSYTVASGDTVYGISRRFGVDLSSLVRLNNMPPPYMIRVGQTLVLPTPVAGQGAGQGAAPSTLAPGQAASAAPTPSEPSKPAEAGRGGVTAVPLPPASAPISPPGAEPSKLEPEPAAAPAEKPAPPTAEPAPMLGRGLSPQPGVSPPRPAVAPASPAAVPAAPPRAGRGFLWPVNGTVLSDFGAKGGGLHNDGINIAAPRGTPVRAADAGVVAYAGNELRGFGNLLLIKHADGWITAYAHNDRLLVKRGDTVRRGQSIAHVGSTGSAGAPQLHFEIRRGPQAVDPRRYLSDPGA